MKLANPFPTQTRELFRDCWECWECGENGQQSGGLELHHITGRDSNSPLNGAILCKKCHAHACHNHEEEQRYTFKTLKFLYNMGYSITSKDIHHLETHPYLVTQSLTEWIARLPINTKTASDNV